MKKMNSINETAKLCKEYNIGISRAYLLELANSGQIPCVKVGQKYLINWDKLMEFLDSSKLPVEEPKPGIRKIIA